VTAEAVVIARPARLTDTDAIGELHVRTWRAAYAGIIPDAILETLDPRVKAAQWARVFRPGSRTRLLAAEHDGAVVGFAAFGPHREPDLGDETGELYAIYVTPEAWGIGAGHALMVEVVSGLRRAGHRRGTLRVLDANERARAFYEREGWTFDKVTDPYDADGTLIPEVRYRRDL
jgi:GNAT superfamily N-acetyltransferase